MVRDRLPAGELRRLAEDGAGAYIVLDGFDGRGLEVEAAPLVVVVATARRAALDLGQAVQAREHEAVGGLAAQLEPAGARAPGNLALNQAPAGARAGAGHDVPVLVGCLLGDG